jgi:hypothetical protein
MDQTFFTRSQAQKSAFERKYLEHFGNVSDKRMGLPGLSPQLVDKIHQQEVANSKLADARAKFEL